MEGKGKEEALKQALYRIIKGKSNVIGFSTALHKKLVKGKPIEERAIRFYVSRKLPEKALSIQDILPKTVTIDGKEYLTDVVEIGEVKALGKRKFRRQEINRTDKVRPLVAGISIGHYQITAGTLGAFVTDGTYEYILSNNHVIANSNHAKAGDPILQPGPYDGGSPTDRVASLTRFIPIRFNSPRGCISRRVIRRLIQRVRPQALLNIVDAGIAQLEDTYLNKTIDGLYILKQPSDPEINEFLWKSGRTTGLTNGRIIDTNAVVTVDYGEDGKATFENQIMTTAMSRGGDSGSLMGYRINDNLCPVGLLFAGSDTVTIANPIKEVLKQLGVEFVGS